MRWFATHTGTFFSSGLKYEADNHAESLCNTLTTTSVQLIIKGGALLMMPPQLSSQREYMRKSEAERLALLLRDASAEFNH